MNTLILLRTLAYQQQYPELKAACQSFLTDAPEPAIYPLLALAHVYLGEYAFAQQVYEQALSHQEDYDADALSDLAAVLMAFHRLDEAAALLHTALAQQPDDPVALARLGVCCLGQGDQAAAQAHLQRALDLAPQRLTLYSHLVHLRLQQAALEPAQTLLEQAFAQLVAQHDQLPEPTSQHYRHLFSRLQLLVWADSGQFAAAEQWLQAQLAEENEHHAVQALTDYAQLLAERDLHGQASEMLRQGLKHYPHNSALCIQSAELAQVQGHFMPAVTLLRRALKQDQSNIALWVQLASACLHRFDQQARHAAEKAVQLADALEEDAEHPAGWIQLRRLQAKNALAQVESQEQHFERAEALYREILEVNPQFLPALQGLGQQLMQQGQIDEALALFERVKQIDPLKGHAALINARRFPEDEATLHHMERAARTPGLEGSVKAGLLFQLAAAWEKRKDYEKAFDCARLANQASKKFLPYDGKAHRNYCAHIRARFSRALYQHRSGCGVDSRLPVYVLGMPRSGTTLIEQIIAGHSQIFGAGELGVIPQVVQGLNRWERHTGSGRSYPDCMDDLNAYAVQGIANNVLKELQEYAPDASHIVDKLPHNFENIGLIKFLFPQARIISVRRDPRDIAVSNYFTDYQAKHGGMGFAYDLTDIGEQLADHNLLMHHWHQVFPGEILEIHYEEVVNDLEGSARKLLDYIGVAWEPQVLVFNELDRPVKTASVWQVRQPLYKTSKEKWRHYQNHLAPLIQGTNAPIRPDEPDMLTLPLPGFLTDGVALFREGDLDGAELSFKKMLHHNPAHAACQYMVGLVYLRKNHLDEGIVLIEQALKKAPWHKEWRDNLIKAYELTGAQDKAAALAEKYTPGGLAEIPDDTYSEDPLAAFATAFAEHPV